MVASPLCHGSDSVYDLEHTSLHMCSAGVQQLSRSRIGGRWVCLNYPSALFTRMTRRLEASQTDSWLYHPVSVSSWSGQGLWSPHRLHVCFSASHSACRECCGPHPQHMSQVECAAAPVLCWHCRPVSSTVHRSPQTDLSC